MLRILIIAAVAPLCAIAPASGPSPKPDIAAAASPAVWLLSETYRQLFLDRAAVVGPTTDTAANVILIHAAGGINVIDAATGRRLWPRPAACAREPLLIGSDEGRFFLATPHRIFALRRIDGRLAWQFGDHPPADAGVDPESLTEWTHHAMTVRRLVARSNRGDLVCLDLRDGSLRWRREAVTGVVDSELVMDDRHVCYVERSRRRRSRCVLDASSGKAIRAMGLDGDTPCQSLVRADDGALLVLYSRTILCVEPHSGTVRWRVRTSGRLVGSTLATNDHGVFVSDDGLHVTKYDPRAGRVLWQTPPIGAPPGHGGLWVQLDAGRLLTGANGVLMASDAADGRILWVAHNPPKLQTQSPVRLGDALVTMELAKGGAATRSTEDEQAIGEPADARRYRIRRFNVSDGRERPVIAGGELVTPPLGVAARLSARRNALAVLDGQHLIGYVGARDRKPQPEP